MISYLTIQVQKLIFSELQKTKQQIRHMKKKFLQIILCTVQQKAFKRSYRF